MPVEGASNSAPGSASGRAAPAAESAVPTDDAGGSPTPREAAALRRVNAVSYVLDDAIRIPGTNVRFGLDPILGVLPVGGDLVSAVLALYPILEAYRFGASTPTLAWMLGRVVVDAVVGSIPVLGGVFDAVYKANKWNTKTLERHLEARN